jgi:hypothetical protein
MNSLPDCFERGVRHAIKRYLDLHCEDLVTHEIEARRIAVACVNGDAFAAGGRAAMAVLNGWIDAMWHEGRHFGITREQAERLFAFADGYVLRNPK